MPRPKKRSFSIKRHRTSLSLEEPFLNALRDVATTQNIPLAALVAKIDAQRGDEDTGLSSAVRIYILNHYRQLAQPNAPDQTTAPDSKNATDD